jgi:hypothetical protein
MRVVLVLAATWAVALVAPSWADAETWKGTTRQGRGVVIHTGSGGVVDRVRIGWKARCGDGTYKSRTLFRAPLDEATTSSFLDAGTYRGHPPGYDSRIRVRIAGSLDDGSWHGTFRVRVSVTQDGERVDTCRIKRLRWRARPA